MDTALKIAKLNAKVKQLDTAKELFLAVLDNPAVELIAGTILIEYWRNTSGGSVSHQIVDSVIATALEVSLAAVVTAKAISPALNSPAAAALVGKYLT